MSNRLLPNPPLASAWALTMVWGVTAICAGQTQPSSSNAPVLDSKTASRLLIDEVKPEYPAIAKVNYIQGSVRMQVRVTSEGRVTEAHVVRGHPFLAEAALQAVRRWVYRPLLTAGGASDFLTFVDVKFALHSKNIDRLPPTPERDLDRQVQPPSPPRQRRADASAGAVRMHVLVGAKGGVLDARPLAGPAAEFNAARKEVEGWKFTPAHWGNHPVPWYLDVNVRVDAPAAADSGDPASAQRGEPPPPQ